MNPRTQADPYDTTGPFHVLNRVADKRPAVTQIPVTTTITKPTSMRIDPVGLAAIVAGTCCIAWSGIIFRFSDVGPITAAAWRMIIAVPALMVWMRVLTHGRGAVSTPVVGFRVGALIMPVTLAGLAFAVDVACFHLSLTGTSITNATFIGNIAPILAVVGGTVFFAEHPRRVVWLALVLAFVGSWVMAGMVAPMHVGTGDILALAAAVAYSSYLLIIKRLRRVLDGPSATMWSAIASAVVLTAAAVIFEPQFFPTTLRGWAVVIALGLGSHAMGQGLTSVAMGRVTVGIIAAVLLAQPPVSAVLAYLTLGEGINAFQICGGTIILAALVLARPR